jgi:hypothetical protein
LKKAASASFAPASVSLQSQLLVDEHGFNPLRVHSRAAGNQLALGFGAAAVRSWNC